MFQNKGGTKEVLWEHKKNVRKEVAEANKEINRTGGGPYENRNDSLQDLTLNLINKKTVFGLSNSFDGDSAGIEDNLLDNLEHNYAEKPKMSVLETDENGVGASNGDKNVQASIFLQKFETLIILFFLKEDWVKILVVNANKNINNI